MVDNVILNLSNALLVGAPPSVSFSSFFFFQTEVKSVQFVQFLLPYHIGLLWQSLLHHFIVLPRDFLVWRVSRFSKHHGSYARSPSLYPGCLPILYFGCLLSLPFTLPLIFCINCVAKANQLFSLSFPLVDPPCVRLLVLTSYGVYIIATYFIISAQSVICTLTLIAYIRLLCSTIHLLIIVLTILPSLYYLLDVSS